MSCYPSASHKKPICNTEKRRDFINLEGEYFFSTGSRDNRYNEVFILRESKGLYKIIYTYSTATNSLPASVCHYDGYWYLEVFFDRNYFLHRLIQNPNGDLEFRPFFARKELLIEKGIPYAETPPAESPREIDQILEVLLKTLYSLNIDNREISTESFFHIIDPVNFKFILSKTN